MPPQGHLSQAGGRICQPLTQNLPKGILCLPGGEKQVPLGNSH